MFKNIRVFIKKREKNNTSEKEGSLSGEEIDTIFKKIRETRRLGEKELDELIKKFELDQYYIILRNSDSLSEYLAILNDLPDGKYEVIVTTERGAADKRICDTIEEAYYKLFVLMCGHRPLYKLQGHSKKHTD